MRNFKAVLLILSLIAFSSAQEQGSAKYNIENGSARFKLIESSAKKVQQDGDGLSLGDGSSQGGLSLDTGDTSGSLNSVSDVQQPEVIPDNNKNTDFNAYELSLEEALQFSAITIQCDNEEQFSGYKASILSWIEILTNPDLIDKDLDLLRQVKQLMEFAKQTVEDIEKQWKPQKTASGSQNPSISVSTTNFIQLPIQINEMIQKSETKLPKMYPSKMKDFLEKVRSISTEGGEATRQEIIIEVLAQIDVLIDQLRALQIKRPDFPKFIKILTSKLADIEERKRQCTDKPAQLPDKLPEDVVVTPIVQQPKSIEVVRPDDGAVSGDGTEKTKSIEVNGDKAPEVPTEPTTKDGHSVTVDNQKNPASANIIDGDKKPQAEQVYIPKSGQLNLAQVNNNQKSRKNNSIRRDTHLNNNI